MVQKDVEMILSALASEGTLIHTTCKNWCEGNFNLKGGECHGQRRKFKNEELQHSWIKTLLKQGRNSLHQTER
jgi:hypothetical protein